MNRSVDGQNERPRRTAKEKHGFNPNVIPPSFVSVNRKKKKLQRVFVYTRRVEEFDPVVDGRLKTQTRNMTFPRSTWITEREHEVRSNGHNS